MKYTIRDINEKAICKRNDQYGETYLIDNHTIALNCVWSYSGGRSTHLVTVLVDGKVIATRCKRDTGLRKALAVLNA